MHFRFLKIPVSVHPSYWLFLLLVMGAIGGLCMEGFLWAIVLTFSILIHEYGHALTALYFGAAPRIVLQAFGGNTSFNEASITDKQKFLVTLAGPLFQALLALIAYMLLHFHVVHLDLCNYLLFLMFHINTRWLLLNLLPIAPFDGGLLVRYILEKKFGHKGYLASIIIGLIAAAIAIPYCYLQQYHWFFIMQLFLSGWQYCKLWQKKTDV